MTKATNPAMARLIAEVENAIENDEYIVTYCERNKFDIYSIHATREEAERVEKDELGEELSAGVVHAGEFFAVRDAWREARYARIEAERAALLNSVQQSDAKAETTTIELEHGMKAYLPATYRQVQYLRDLLDEVPSEWGSLSNHARMKYTCRHAMSAAIDEAKAAKERGEHTVLVLT